MTEHARFLQIHTLTPYAAALLNRDDIGRAKRLPFGGADRVRVSSQCLKRHWRTAVGAWGLGELAPLAVRSRHIFDRVVAPRLQERGLDDEAIVAALLPIRAVLLGESDKAAANPRKPKEGEGPLDQLRTEQVIVLGPAEIDFIVEAAAALGEEIAAAEPKERKKIVQAYAREHRDNLSALARAAGLDAALFGRMVTSDVLARGDAAVHVAHSFTVHAEEAEPDYFSAVDDLVAAEGELGAGHINTTELTSGLFYGYVVVDLAKLGENLSGDAGLAGAAVERLVHLIAEVSPGAKLGSTAPYAWAELVLAELGARQPRSLANAFLKPVRTGTGDGVQHEAVRALGDHLRRFEAMYGAAEERRLATMLDPVEGLPAPIALDALASWAGTAAAEAAS